MAFAVPGGATSSREQEGFGVGEDRWIVGFEQVAHGSNRSLLPGHYFQSGSQFSSIFPAQTDTWRTTTTCNSNTCFGFSYDNMSFPNSASNMKRPVGFSNKPSTSNTFPLQMESSTPNMTNFYNGSVLQCKFGVLPKVSQRKLPPPSCSSMNFFNNEHLHVEKTKTREECMCSMSSKLIATREHDPLETIQISRQPVIHSSLEEFDDEFKDTELKLILRKELSNSDVGSVGRIVLPKKEAEANLPPLIERDGIILHMDDFELPATWKFKYRFWPNNKSRMYIMETTGDFVKAHGLQTGDFFIIYRSSASGNYVVRGKKIIRPPAYVEILHCNCKKQCNVNEDCNTQQLGSGYVRGDKHQLVHEQSKSYGHIGSSSIAMTGMHSSRMDFLSWSGGEHIGFNQYPETIPENISFGGVLP